MMKARYHMQKNGQFIESESRKTLERLRRTTHKELFKGARIKHVIQMLADEIEVEKIHKVRYAIGQR